MRPRIGITTSTLDRSPEGAIQVSAATHLAYAHCVYQAGGLPFLLPNLPETDDAGDVIAQLDGLLLSGGGDLDPAYWQEPPHPALGVIDHVRDQYEIALFRAALQRDLPTLGICRGVQVMAVATGGDLWQDIPSQCPHSLNHRQTHPREEPCHHVAVQPDSLLARILWPAGAEEYSMAVNSFHHQAPRNYGTLLTAIATCQDGIIEALTAPTAHFVLGVQWHPENMVSRDPVHARVFTALIDAAANRVIADRH